MAKKRPNVIPIIEDARHPQKYRMLVPMVDVVFADVAQPDQVRTHAECHQPCAKCFYQAMWEDRRRIGTAFECVQQHRGLSWTPASAGSLDRLLNCCLILTCCCYPCSRPRLSLPAGAYRGPQLPVLFEEWRLLCHLHQGIVHRLHGTT